MTKKLMLALGLVAALALPAGAVAKPTKTDRKNAAKECKLLRGTTDAEHEAFHALYKNFGACVSKLAREEAAERKAARRSAVKDCREERETLGAEAFADKYGTNANKKNAFGKCVSKAAKKEEQAEDAEDREEIAELKNAAKECDAERTEIGEQAFADKYGTNANKKNAFGKCVSSKAADDDEESGTQS
jgi:hypothetical protein